MRQAFRESQCDRKEIPQRIERIKVFSVATYRQLINTGENKSVKPVNVFAYFHVHNQVREVSTQPHTPRVLEHPSSLTLVWSALGRVSCNPPVLTASGGPTDYWHPTIYIYINLPREVAGALKQPGRPCWPEPHSLHSSLNPFPCTYIPHRSARGVRPVSWRQTIGKDIHCWGKPRITTYGLSPHASP